jgi:hypothetical protein
MSVTHYTSSKGQRLAIADMARPYLKSALAKLEHEQPERTEEIDAMREELAKRDEAFAKEQAQ